MGLTKRRLYKPERAPARYKAWKATPGTRLTEANLSQYEAELGVAAIAEDDFNMRVGRILGYDQHANFFLVVGNKIKARRPWARPGNRIELDPKPIEQVIMGSRVSQAILSARIIAGVSRLTRELSGR